MRRIGCGIMAGIIAMLVASYLGTPSASADGGPHTQGQGMTTDACAGCHRAHTGKAAYLLKEDEAQLCATCHEDGLGSSLNVKRGVNTATGGALKAGGFTEARINTQDPTWSRSDPNLGVLYGGGATNEGTLTIGALTTAQPVLSSHSVDGSAQTVWGNGAVGSGAGFASFNLSCSSCHDPHGNGQYRILRPAPASTDGATDRETSVLVLDENPKVYTTTNYFDNGPQGMSGWCSQCHSRYFSSSYTSGSTPLAGEDVFTYRHVSAAPWAPSCVKCHAAHGSNAVATGVAATVEYPGSTTPAGGSRLLKMDNRGICQKCHNR